MANARKKDESEAMKVNKNMLARSWGEVRDRRIGFP